MHRFAPHRWWHFWKPPPCISGNVRSISSAMDWPLVCCLLVAPKHQARFHRKWICQVHCIYHPARLNAAICFFPPARGSLGIIYTGSIDVDTHAGRQGRDMDLTRCCLQPGPDAADNCLIDIFNCFLSVYRLFVIHPGRSVHSTTYRPSSSCSIKIENVIIWSYIYRMQGISIKTGEKESGIWWTQRRVFGCQDSPSPHQQVEWWQ